MKSGSVGNVLPQHKNVKYVDYPPGSHFGTMDIVSSCFSSGIKVQEWVIYHDKLKREFSVMAQEESELLTLSINSLETMKDDFEEQYSTLFAQGIGRLLRMLKIKKLAIKYC